MPRKPNDSDILGVHMVIPRTRVNGPGVRFGIWTQGCLKKCRGCFNPAAHEILSPDAREFVRNGPPGYLEVEKLIEWIIEENLSEPLEGITISGGEPFLQNEPLYKLLAEVRKIGLSTLVFTGFTKEELDSEEKFDPFFKPESLIDILIDGPFEESRRIECELRGSDNQRIILLTDRYSENDLTLPGSLECIIEPDGSVILTGFTRPPEITGTKK